MQNRKIKILLVDDQALILDILSRGLNQYDFLEVVGTATDGYLALNQLNRLKPDVILLDMEMPRMNGIQFLHNLMPVKPIPTIVLSALTHKDSKITDDAFNAGAVDFVPKPSGGSGALKQLFNQLVTRIRIAATKDVSHYKKPRNNYTLPSNALDRAAKTSKIVLGMGGFEISNDEKKELKIFALGSCIGLGLFCPLKGYVGFAHVALPSSSSDIEKSINLPGYFADTAVKALLNKMLEVGCPKNKIFAKIAGGSKTRVELGDYFAIGQKNTVAVKAALLKSGIKILAEDVGKDISRTAFVKANDNMMKLHHPEKGIWEI